MQLLSWTTILTFCAPCEAEPQLQDEFLSRSNRTGDPAWTLARTNTECQDYMAGEGCSWTSYWNCPGQETGSRGRANDDGTVGYDCCCKQERWKESCCDRELVDYVGSYWVTQFSITIGNSEGPCCKIDSGFSSGKKVKLWSASKMVTGYLILRLMDTGLLSLETRAADVLDWWTTDPLDKRSNVTVWHLLSQTDGMSKYHILGMPIGLGLCPEGDTVSCAKYAHDHLFVASPGEKFTYSETSFYVLGAIAMKVTGFSNFDSVFQEMIARPLGMHCEFAGAAITKSSIKSDPGAGLECSADEYRKFLRVVYAQTFVSPQLHAEAERPQTVNTSNMPEKAVRTPGGIRHYALGSYRDCADETCADDDGVKIDSMGALGFYPWIWRNGRDSHWGILATESSAPVANGIMDKGFPLVRKAMEQMPIRSTTTTTTTTITITTTTTTTTSIISKNSTLLSECERGARRISILMLAMPVSIFLRIW